MGLCLHTASFFFFQNPGSSLELKAIRDRERILQEELLVAQKENLTLRFDCEQAAVDLPRLKVGEFCGRHGGAMVQEVNGHVSLSTV